MIDKLKTVAIVALLVIVAGAVVVDGVTDSDASVSATGSVKVFYKDDGVWESKVVNAFDVYQAVQSAKVDLGYTVTITDENSTWNIDEGGYWNPDINYGNISQIDGSSDFTISVYNNSDSQWVIAEDSLGWYRPFADYATSVSFQSGVCAGASNVAISADGTTPSTEETIGLTQITNTSDYRYAFTLKDNRNAVDVPAGTMVWIQRGLIFVQHELTASELAAGITIYGYGSDAYLALKNAISPVVGGVYTFELCGEAPYQYYKYYSWMDTILEAGTQTINGTEGERNYSQYVYWVQSGTNTTAGGDYTLGYYSKLSGGYNDLDEFTLTYEITEKYYY